MKQVLLVFALMITVFGVASTVQTEKISYIDGVQILCQDICKGGN